MSLDCILKFNEYIISDEVFHRTHIETEKSFEFNK